MHLVQFPYKINSTKVGIEETLNIHKSILVYPHIFTYIDLDTHMYLHIYIHGLIHLYTKRVLAQTHGADSLMWSVFQCIIQNNYELNQFD